MVESPTTEAGKTALPELTFAQDRAHRKTLKSFHWEKFEYIYFACFCFIFDRKYKAVAPLLHQWSLQAFQK